MKRREVEINDLPSRLLEDGTIEYILECSECGTVEKYRYQKLSKSWRVIWGFNMEETVVCFDCFYDLFLWQKAYERRHTVRQHLFSVSQHDPEG